jgi:hypothetical protein
VGLVASGSRDFEPMPGTMNGVRVQCLVALGALLLGSCGGLTTSATVTANWEMFWGMLESVHSPAADLNYGEHEEGKLATVQWPVEVQPSAVTLPPLQKMQLGVGHEAPHERVVKPGGHGG